MFDSFLLVVSRLMIAALFLFSGIGKVRDYDATKSMMTEYKFPLVTLSLISAILIEIVGGLLLAVGISVGFVSIVFIVYIAAATVMVLFKQLKDPNLRKTAWLNIAKNCAIIGALIHWYVAAGKN